MAASPRKTFIIDGFRPLLTCQAGAVLRERNTPAAATSTRANGTTAATSRQFNGMANVIFACLAAQLNAATGHGLAEPRSHCNCSPLSSRAGNTQSSAATPEADTTALRGLKNDRTQVT